MKLGILARGEDRGLGVMTQELHRNLRPDRTLLIDLGDLARGFPTHPDRFDECVIVPWDGHPLSGLWEQHIRGWLDGIDVLYSAETFYDWRIVDWARDAGVRTVLHAMPEFWPARLNGRPMPDVVWAPTTWRLDTLPAATRLVPVPVALDHFTLREPRSDDEPLRVLHTAGHKAAADRNGTQLVTRAISSMRERIHVTITGQDGRLPTVPSRVRGRVTIETRPRSTSNYWDVYTDQDVLLLPRRYGGLCLPVQEGLAAGLVPILPDVSPNSDWPAVLTPSEPRGQLATAAGVLPLASSRPVDLAAAVNALAADREMLAARRRLALAWAHAHSWEALAPLYLAELDRATR